MTLLDAGEEPLEDVAYIHDGTLEGLLSAVFMAYERRELPGDIVSERAYQPRLGQSVIAVQTREDLAWRVRRGVERAAGREAFLALMRASACDDYDVGVIVLRFVRYVIARSREERTRPVLDELAQPAVLDLMKLSRRVVNECEKARQFIRFSQMDNGVWFARFHPSASVVPFVMGYFAARLNDQPFVIYDDAHDIAGIYDGRRWELASDVAALDWNFPGKAASDAYYQEAWKRFYDALANDARYNPELRRHFMPVRLWRDLPEMQPRRRAPSTCCATIDAGLRREHGVKGVEQVRAIARMSDSASVAQR